MICNGFIAMVIVLGTLASVGCSREVPGRQAKQSTFEAEGMNHGALTAEAPDGSADNGSALRWDSGGPASQSVNLSGPANHIVVRSRNAVASTGVVEITVLVDGVPQGTKQIGEKETGYRNRSWSVDVPRGEHTISL
jgi:hypothetical protein